MAQFDENDLTALFHLARIEWRSEEKEKFLQTLSNILRYVDLLHEVDTDEVKPCDHLMESLVNAMREDIVGELLPRDTFLANAPSQVGGMVRIPPVIKFN